MEYKKLYKEALERAKESFEKANGMILKKWLVGIFPELAESEDEKIRKELIDIIKSQKEQQCRIDGAIYDKMLAWLEKQGEQKPVNEDAEKEKSNYVSGQFLYCKGSFNEFKEGESYWLEYIGNDTYVGRSDNVLNQKFHITPRQLYTWLDPRHPEHPKEEAPMSYGKELESKLRDACARYYSNGGDTISLAGVFYAGVEAQKEIEQKPVDKVEPKFHEGDWAVSNLDKKTRQISEVHFDEYNSYYVVNGKSVNLEEYDRLHHLWTIEDAKDGDVLVDVYGNIGIFQKNDDFDWTSYCSLGVNGGFQNFKVEHENDKTHPATKEQRDLLFQKMKESGYERKDKELIEIPKSKESIAEPIYEKESWSEEDEKMCNDIIRD